jgi:hypothetical protein
MKSMLMCCHDSFFPRPLQFTISSRHAIRNLHRLCNYSNAKLQVRQPVRCDNAHAGERTAVTLSLPCCWSWLDAPTEAGVFLLVVSSHTVLLCIIQGSCTPHNTHCPHHFVTSSLLINVFIAKEQQYC